MTERAYPEDPHYVNKTKYYNAFIERYEFGKKYTQDKMVLDIPCGSGWGTSLIDNAKEIYGIDISSDAIQYAQSHFSATFLKGSMTKIDFEDNKFDTALCFEGIEHITRQEGIEFINEIKRVVKKDGLIIASVPILNKYGEDTGNPYHKFEYPENYLKILLEENFKIIKYINEKGGDGPIVYFVLKNHFKHKLTMLTSAYKNEEKFKKIINNTLKQNSNDFEIIIINDNSNHRSTKILQNYTDDRIKIVNYKFKKRTNLLRKFYKKNYTSRLLNLITSILPNFLLRVLKKIKHILKI